MRVVNKVLILFILLSSLSVSAFAAHTPLIGYNPADGAQLGDRLVVNFTSDVDLTAYDNITFTRANALNQEIAILSFQAYDKGAAALIKIPPGGSPGPYVALIKQLGGSPNYGINFSVALAPVFTAVTPNYALLNDSLTMILTGTGFNKTTDAILPVVDITNDTTGRTRFNNSQVTWVSATHLQVLIRPIPQTFQVGDYDVVLRNPNGSSTDPAVAGDKAFNIHNSSYTTDMDPNTAQTGDTKVVRITGANYYQTLTNDPTVKISGAGGVINANNITFNSASRLTASITIPGGTAAGNYNLWVTNPNGSYIIMPNAMAIAGGPTVVSVSPGQINNGQTSTLNITGTGFIAGAAVAGPPGAIVETFVSSTRLTAQITLDNAAANIGTYAVAVTNPGGSTGNLANALAIVAPAGDGGGDGGGGGGSSGGSGVGAASGVKAGQTAQVALKGDGSAVSEVDIKVSKDTPAIIVTATKKNYLPSDVPSPGTQTYQYLDIKALKVDPSAIDEATIDFSVPRSWLTQNGFEPTDVVMRHYNEGTGAWDDLPTEVVSVAGGTVYYRAVTTGFSYFAISYEEGGAVMEDTSAAPVTKIAAASTPAASVPATTTPAPAPATAEEPAGELPVIYIIIAVVLILIIAVVGIAFYRSKQEELPDWWQEEEE